jgi:voltage-dependent potassium channel beta subunit
MKYRRLGNTGLKVSELSLGGWLTFGNAVEQDRARLIFDKAFELGINVFDTANAYAAGEGEKAFGQLLKDRKRSDFILATKVFFPMGPGPNDRGLSRKHVFEQCHASLKRLQTDYIDLYQCHRHDPETPIEETIRTMEDLLRQGKILYWGFSEWPAEEIEKAIRVADEHGWTRPATSQPGYSLLRRGPEEAVFPLTLKHGIGNLAFSPLAQGALTGKYKPGQPYPATSRAGDDRQNKFIQKYVDDQTLLEKIQRLQSIADELSCSMTQLAIAWVLRRPEVSTTIIGASRPDQIAENVGASGIVLDEATVKRIEQTLA